MSIHICILLQLKIFQRFICYYYFGWHAKALQNQIGLINRKLPPRRYHIAGYEVYTFILNIFLALLLLVILALSPTIEHLKRYASWLKRHPNPKWKFPLSDSHEATCIKQANCCFHMHFEFMTDFKLKNHFKQWREVIWGEFQKNFQLEYLNALDDIIIKIIRSDAPWSRCCSPVLGKFDPISIFEKTEFIIFVFPFDVEFLSLQL